MVESGTVRLADLFRDVEGSRIVGDPSLDVSSLSYRSSTVGPGHLFFCVPGFVRDGHEFAPEAVVSRRRRPLRGAGTRSAGHPGRRALGALGDGSGGLLPLRASERPSADGRYHRHERQDHHRLLDRLSSRRRRGDGRASWARSSGGWAGSCSPPSEPPRSRSTSSRTWPSWSTRAIRRR